MTTPVDVEELHADPLRAPRRSVIRRVVRGRGLVGLVLVGLVLLAGALAPLLAPYLPTEQIPGANLLGPSAAHLFGADEVDRHTVSRTLFGIRSALVVVFVAVPLGALVGALVGLVSTLSRVADVV